MTRKFLLVDDSRVSRMMLKAMLLDQHPDCEVDEAANAEEARARVAAFSYDLISIDFNMPGDNGLVLAEELKQSGCAAHLALLTANIQESIRQRADALGVRFIKKPISSTSISALLGLLD